MTVALCLLACGAAAAEPPAGPSGAVPEGVVRATLPNGLRVIAVPDRLAPVVTVELNYLAGSNDAPAGFPGTAHALEHMMFRGSEGLDRDQLAELSARLGGMANANTTETVTRYTATVPADDLPLVLHSEALRMTGLLLRQSDWEQERGAIEQEVSRDLSSPFYTYVSQAQAILFADTPYQFDALGSRPTFDRTDAAMLRRFYETWYAPNNAVLVIAGDVSPRAAVAAARTAFGAIPGRAVPAHKPVVPIVAPARTLTLPTDFPFGVISLAYRMPGLRDADFAAADILGDVLGSQRGALHELVPQGRALLAQFDYRAKPDVGFAVALAAFPTGGDPAPLLADLRKVIADAARDGVPVDLVEAAKRRELAQLAFSSDSIEGLADSWTDAVAFQGAESPDDLARAYAAVTVADVNRLARALLDPDHAVTAILTPRGGGAPASGGGFGGAESLSTPPDHPVTLPDWASSTLAAPRLPDPVAAPDVSVLPNGLRLIVQPEHVSRTVSVYGHVRQVTETEEPAGQEGVAALTEDLFGYGTTAHDRLAFRKAVDDLGAALRAGPDFSLKVLAPHFAAGMALLAENELHPAPPDDAFAVARKQLAQGVAGQRLTPDYKFERAAQRAIVPPGDASLREATQATITALRPDDVATYRAAAYRPDLTTLVVIGDVTPEQARRVVADTFGDWRADGLPPDIDLPPVGASPASQARVPDESSLQDSVALTESITLPIANADRYKLILGNIVLGDGFASRLYRDLRGSAGYVYSVDSVFDWSRTRGDYTVEFGADPRNVERARALVLRDLKDMRTTPVSDAELTRAKSSILRWLPMQRASVPAIAARLLRLADLGLPLDSNTTVAARYLDISARDIEDAFATWVRPDDLSEVVKGPPLAQ
jgi:zinc protease